MRLIIKNKLHIFFVLAVLILSRNIAFSQSNVKFYCKENNLVRYTNIDSALLVKDEVYVLDLSRQKLKQLDPRIVEFENLIYLNLAKNRFDSLTCEFSSFKKLEILNISQNTISFLPSCIGELDSLVEFYAFKCDLEELPHEISNLHNLKKMEIWATKIYYLPTSISELQNTLEFVDLQVNYMNPKRQEEIKSLLPNTEVRFSIGCYCVPY